MAHTTSLVLTERQLDLTAEGTSLASAAELDAFLRDVEARAYRIALATMRDPDEALDVVQESMIKLARRYASRPPEEWTPLFYRILQNKTRDWHRRQAVRRKLFGLWGSPLEERDPIADAPGEASDEPLNRTERDGAMRALEAALKQLPGRQAEAFMLRNFEGMDVKSTALAMGCTPGSVKTHYSRAVHRLREMLGDHWQ